MGMRLKGLIVTVWLVSVTPLSAATPRIDFQRDVRPILAEHCLQCHGPDHAEAKVRLSSREDVLGKGESGLAILTPNHPEQSELIRRITAADPTERMPPEGKKPLTAAQIATLKAWIAEGAEWSGHWAFQPIAKPALPSLKESEGVRKDIDRFVRAALEAKGWKPSPEADRTTLIKRLSYDLLGLPPTIEEVDAFLADRSPTAYEDLVDRLLASPHFGERWGRHWLDLAHYADSDGYEKDRTRPDAFHYRDWVIQSINRDQPFDQFTVEQLAGDLLPEATADQILATAFLRQTLTNEEGGVDQEEFRINACFDRTETVGSVWLGLTVGCVRCHGHKYDPIPHDDYYRLFAFFNNAEEASQRLPISGDDRAALDRELQPLRQALAARQRELAPAQAQWEVEQREQLLQIKSDSNVSEAPLAILSAKSTALPEAAFEITAKVIRAPLDQRDNDTYVLEAEPTGPFTGVKLITIPEERAPNRGAGLSPDGTCRITRVSAALLVGDQEQPVALHRATADASATGTDPTATLTDAGGWAPGGKGDSEHWLQFRTTGPVELPAGAKLRLVIEQQAGKGQVLGQFRVALLRGNIRGLHLSSQAIVTALDMYPEKRVASVKKQLFDDFVENVVRDPQVKELKQQIAAAERRHKAKLAEIRTITAALVPRTTHVFHRGEFLSPRNAVTAGGMTVLPAIEGRQAGLDRRDLAEWLVSPAQPLTARVAVNHVWQHLFGHGLVRTSADFGVRGERPSHPELLDWLAESYRTDWGWKRKELIRQIVRSATYRQASQHRPHYEVDDPTNTLLFRQNRFRVEAEVVRDLSLAASGLLNRTVGGPSVFPPMPDDLAKLSYANNFSWKNSAGADRYRRGMYTFFKRTIPHPNLMTFDAPDANVACVVRTVSNTPLQSLLLLNNEVHHEAAQALAQRVLKEVPEDDTQRLERGFRLCVARPPQSDERAALNQLLAENRTLFSAKPDLARSLMQTKDDQPDPIEPAAWTAVARVLLNLDEFLTRE